MAECLYIDSFCDSLLALLDYKNTRTGSLGFAPLAIKWLTSFGSAAGLGGLPTGKGELEGGGPQSVLTGLKLL